MSVTERCPHGDNEPFEELGKRATHEFPAHSFIDVMELDCARTEI